MRVRKPFEMRLARRPEEEIQRLSLYNDAGTSTTMLAPTSVEGFVQLVRILCAGTGMKPATQSSVGPSHFGGMLWRAGRAMEWFAEPITRHDVKRFGLVVGDCKHQALLELLAVLIAARLWKEHFGRERGHP